MLRSILNCAKCEYVPIANNDLEKLACPDGHVETCRSPWACVVVGGGSNPRCDSVNSLGINLIATVIILGRVSAVWLTREEIIRPPWVLRTPLTSPLPVKYACKRIVMTGAVVVYLHTGAAVTIGQFLKVIIWWEEGVIGYWLCSGYWHMGVQMVYCTFNIVHCGRLIFSFWRFWQFAESYFRGFNPQPSLILIDNKFAVVYFSRIVCATLWYGIVWYHH